MSTQPGKSSAIENTVERIRELNDRIVTSAKSSGNEAIETYERMLENLAEAQEAAGDRGAEWVKEFARAQAVTKQRFPAPIPVTSFTRGERAMPRLLKLIRTLYGR